MHLLWSFCVFYKSNRQAHSRTHSESHTNHVAWYMKNALVRSDNRMQLVFALIGERYVFVVSGFVCICLKFLSGCGCFYLSGELWTGKVCLATISDICLLFFFAESFERKVSDDFLLIIKWSDMNSVVSEHKEDEWKNRTKTNKRSTSLLQRKFELGQEQSDTAAFRVCIAEKATRDYIFILQWQCGKKETQKREKRKMKNPTGHNGGWCSRKFIYSGKP